MPNEREYKVNLGKIKRLGGTIPLKQISFDMKLCNIYINKDKYTYEQINLHVLTLFKKLNFSKC